MRRAWLVLLLLPALALAGKGDHEQARRLLAAGEIQPLSSILERARTLQPGRVIEVELERERSGWRYEVEILDAHGQVWELEFDARSGELLKRERED